MALDKYDESLKLKYADLLTRLFYEFMQHNSLTKHPCPRTVPMVTLVEKVDADYLHPKIRIVINGQDYILEKELQDDRHCGEVFRVRLSGRVVFEREIAFIRGERVATRQPGNVRVFGEGQWFVPLCRLLDALDSPMNADRRNAEDSLDDVSEKDLEFELDPHRKAFWLLIGAGIGMNWFGGFLRYRGRYSPFSETVIYEALLLLFISCGISGFVGRRSWRVAIAAFVSVSMGVAGFFAIGAR